jgi:hypothetical protein
MVSLDPPVCLPRSGRVVVAPGDCQPSCADRACVSWSFEPPLNSLNHFT